MSTSISKAINFLLGTGKNANGYFLALLWHQAKNQTLNLDTDLQWLFPTLDIVGNGYKSTAEPIVLTVDEANFCRDNEVIQNNQLVSLTHILTYFGFKVMDGTISVRSNCPSFSPNTHLWLTKMNYDALRLACIMTSLMILGHKNLARQLQTLVIESDKITLVAHSDSHQDLTIEFPDELMIIGVVTWVFADKRGWRV